VSEQLPSKAYRSLGLLNRQRGGGKAARHRQ